MEYHGTWNNNSSFLLRQYRPRPVRVFLVDDDLPYLKKAQRKLVSFGCLVKCFDSAKFAKRELNKAEGKVDIVFTDVYTRAMDGFELLDKIKERWNDLPVVMMTVDSNPVIIKRATQQNASFFASKANIDNVLSNFARYVNWVRKATVVDTDHIDVHDQDTNNNGSSTTTTALTMDGWNEMRLIERKGRKRNDDVYWCPSLRNKFFRAVNKLNFTS
ncbi:hypothetical protein H6P81_000764 [Aristolochia fimbriata]|uniref:Response regulatory domain-containing protein n=1 Tax=Aristolochia fimbriata TaxID=158543 RepID=A0AAV7F8W9_ARIFI|nr:hypothetical protein H6P81_000764 [Aristolochia fimbriata]